MSVAAYVAGSTALALAAGIRSTGRLSWPSSNATRSPDEGGC